MRAPDVRPGRVGVVTPVHGRHEHLRRQAEALARGPHRPDLWVVVAIDDDAIGPSVANSGAAPTVRVVAQPAGVDGLPLAAARNLGVETALAEGCDLVVLLDVDCLPGPGLLLAYRAAADVRPDHLLAGAVAYLPPPPAGGYDLDRLADHPPHPARPAPTPGMVETARDHQLFWSLSFAVTARTWHRIGGFDPGYEGYGAEDTDFAQRASSAGVGLSWVGGAEAYHQWHPAGTPPTRHLPDILRNGARFADRWGWWPMQGWLDVFAEQGLVRQVVRPGSTVPGWVAR